MIQYIIRRVLLSLITLFGIIVIVFVIARLLPGDPCLSALGERATEAVCDAYNARFGLDEPIPVQLYKYMFEQLPAGDLGESLRYGRPVTDILIERLPTTVELAELTAARKRIRELETEPAVLRRANELLKDQTDPKAGSRSSPA